MRKLTLIMAAVLCLFTSCAKHGPEGPMGPMGPQGPKGEDGSANFEAIILDVPENAWVYSELPDNNYFCATIQVPEITEDVFDFGMINVYRTYNFDTADASQIVLPYVRLCEEIDGSDVFYYTEAVDYEYGIGWINIYYTVSDFLYEDDLNYKPVAMKFRCIITY